MNPPAFPAPRVVAGWLAHLSRSRPVHALAAGTVTVRRIEAALREDAAASDPLTRAVHRARAVRGATPAELDRLLHLGEQRVDAVLRDAAGRPGRHAVGRRRFAFRNGVRLPLPDPGPFAVPAWSGPAVRPYGWAWLRERLAAEGDDLLSPDDPAAGWRAVVLERDDPLTLVLALDADGTVAAYPTASADAELPSEPLLRLEGGAAREAFPEVFAAPEADSAAAWAGWAASRAVPADDISAARAVLDGLRLRVEPPPRLTDWLRANRAEVFAGEMWLWVGGGPVRRAAALTL